MHDQALMADLMAKIEQIVQDEGASRVRSIRISLGALSHMTPEHFREHFDEVAPGTVAEGAEIEATSETDATAPDAQGIRLMTLDLEYAD